MESIPTIQFGKFRITRILLGSNPFGGFSHTDNQLDEEMMDFYTTENIKKTLLHAQECGINGFCGRGDRHMVRVLRECANEGKIHMHWFCQTVPEISDFKAGIESIIRSKYKPTAIYLHGGMVDLLWQDGKKEIIKEYIKIVKDTGFLTGVASHIPEVIQDMESMDMSIDFYLTCFYNLTGRGKKELTVFSGSKGEKFDPEDPPKMCQVIRSISKPCIAYKILASGRNSKSYHDLENSFKFAFQNIKPIDAVLVGVFQKYKDQIKENIEIVQKLLSFYF